MLASFPGNHGQIPASSIILYFLLCDAREFSLSLSFCDSSCLLSVLFFCFLFFCVCSHHLKKVAYFCHSWRGIITQPCVYSTAVRMVSMSINTHKSSVRTDLPSSTMSYKFMITGCALKRYKRDWFFFSSTVKSIASRRNMVESGALLWLH